MAVQRQDLGRKLAERKKMEEDIAVITMLTEELSVPLMALSSFMGARSQISAFYCHHQPQ